uniref:Uncharacterized protein n=1 Tax=Anguilla anguilla TaxID=7936 RepID=A0A0E9P703_ANGAN
MNSSILVAIETEGSEPSKWRMLVPWSEGLDASPWKRWCQCEMLPTPVRTFNRSLTRSLTQT